MTVLECFCFLKLCAKKMSSVVISFLLQKSQNISVRVFSKTIEIFQVLKAGGTSQWLRPYKKKKLNTQSLPTKQVRSKAQEG